jgi:hypothetical protein
LAKAGKLSKTARASTHFARPDHRTGASLENDLTKGKVFVETKKLLAEAGIGFQNLSSSHPITVNKGSFSQAWQVIKAALVDGDAGRYAVEKEDQGQVVLVEKSPKDPAKLVLRESPFAWHKAG